MTHLLNAILHLSISPGHHSGCGINEDISQWMESVQNSAETTPPSPKPSVAPAPAPRAAPLKSPQTMPGELHEFRHPHEKYSEAANRRTAEDELLDDSADWHATAHERVRRAPPPTPRNKEENKNTCSLYIQTDPLIWRHIREGIADVWPSRAMLLRDQHTNVYLSISNTARSRPQLGD